MIELDFSKPAPKPSSIEECHLVIDAIWTFCANIQKELEHLKQGFMALKKENTELKKRLNSNSNNSSKPPSTDFKKKRRKIIIEAVAVIQEDNQDIMGYHAN